MESIKFLASQAQPVYQYKSLRFKILKCNTDIFFNKQCLAKNIIPVPYNVKTQWDPIAYYDKYVAYCIF